MCLVLTALAGRTWADDHDAGNEMAPAYLIYPDGSKLNQVYRTAAAGTDGALAAFAAAPGAVSPSASASVVAAQPSLVENELTALPMDVSRISLDGNNEGGAGFAAAAPRALWRHGYRLQHKGIPLSKFSSISHVVESSGTDTQTVYIRTTNVPQRGDLPSTTATVNAEDAQALGREDALKALPNIAPKVSNPHREVLVLGEGKPELVWSFIVQAEDPAHIFARQYWVSARDAARIVHREDLVYLEAQEAPEADAAVATGRVTANIWGLGKSPYDPPVPNVPLQDYLGATSGSIKSITNAAGIFSVIGPINTKLMGPFAVVQNMAGALIVPEKHGNNLYFNAKTEAELAQTSALFWVDFAHEFARTYLGSHPTVLLNNPVRVNTNQTCNAFWSNGDHSLNFFKAGNGCVNTAYCDVVCHEFGHGIDAQLGGIKDGGYSEGFGDSVAILITHSPCIGKDFKQKGKCLRDASEIHTWPPSNPEVHEVGKIYNGFTWQLIYELKKTMPEAAAYAVAKGLILGAAALNPKNIPDAVKLSFLVDSKTGSKHFKALAAAADSRKIPRPPAPFTDAVTMFNEN
jgi:hypothetical protein